MNKFSFQQVKCLICLYKAQMGDGNKLQWKCTISSIHYGPIKNIWIDSGSEHHI